MGNMLKVIRTFNFAIICALTCQGFSFCEGRHMGLGSIKLFILKFVRVVVFACGDRGHELIT